jgi:RNA polymerase sigma factor (sigma-70 family)
MAGVARRLAPPAAGSDSDLLARFVDARDPGAFAAIVARHGAAVFGVCRARLGHSADADDAFQVVFYVLARDARRIRDRESVAGWLMRVAHLTAMKVRRHHARHPAGELPADVAAGQHPDGAAAAEERAIVAEELAALPDKFRSVLVLCTVEGRSNTEAAEALGCPRGTVDSRLAAAKAKLRQRLLRRGVGLAAVAGFEAALPRLGADASGWPALADGSWLTAIQYGTGASYPTTLTLIADGVTTTMTTMTKLVATALLAGGLLTTAGFGLTQNPGDSPPVAAKAAKAAPPKKPDATPPKADEKPKPTDTPKATAALTEAQARSQLAKPIADVPDTISLAEFLSLIHKEYGISARVDLPAFSRLSPLPADFRIYEVKLKFPVTTGMSVADLLADAVAQLSPNETDLQSGRIGVGYRVRNGVVLIGPAYRPVALPGRVNTEDSPMLIEHHKLVEQTFGEPVSLALEEVPLKAAIAELRRLTGANIVVDFNKADVGNNSLVSVTFDDVRLYTALEIVGDMCGLKPVFRNNVYYLTSSENAEKLQKKVSEELFGRQQKPLAVPAGYLTDGINLYLNPGNLKPEVFNGSLGGGLGIKPGVEPASPVPAVKK